jgi:hypothetical protein
MAAVRRLADFSFDQDLYFACEAGEKKLLRQNSTVGGAGAEPALVPRLINSFTACCLFRQCSQASSC